MVCSKGAISALVVAPGAGGTLVAFGSGLPVVVGAVTGAVAAVVAVGCSAAMLLWPATLSSMLNSELNSRLDRSRVVGRRNG